MIQALLREGSHVQDAAPQFNDHLLVVRKATDSKEMSGIELDQAVLEGDLGQIGSGLESCLRIVNLSRVVDIITTEASGDPPPISSQHDSCGLQIVLE